MALLTELVFPLDWLSHSTSQNNYQRCPHEVMHRRNINRVTDWISQPSLTVLRERKAEFIEYVTVKSSVIVCNFRWLQYWRDVYQPLACSRLTVIDNSGLGWISSGTSKVCSTKEWHFQASAPTLTTPGKSFLLSGSEIRCDIHYEICWDQLMFERRPSSRAIRLEWHRLSV